MTLTKELIMDTVGFTCSTFDLLHSGHVSMLRNAKKYCDYLIVGLQVDPSIDRSSKSKPVQSLVERYTQLKGISYVDEIVPYVTESDLEELLSMYDIDVRILGEEHRLKGFTGKEICKQRGIECHFNERAHNFSSSELKQRIINSEN